jgi:hypothetical protein
LLKTLERWTKRYLLFEWKFVMNVRCLNHHISKSLGAVSWSAPLRRISWVQFSSALACTDATVVPYVKGIVLLPTEICKFEFRHLIRNWGFRENLCGT